MNIKEIELLVNVNMDNVSRIVVFKNGNDIASGAVIINDKNNTRLKMFVIKIKKDAEIYFSNDIVYSEDDIFTKDGKGDIQIIEKIL